MSKLYCPPQDDINKDIQFHTIHLPRLLLLPLHLSIILNRGIITGCLTKRWRHLPHLVSDGHTEKRHTGRSQATLYLMAMTPTWKMAIGTDLSRLFLQSIPFNWFLNFRFCVLRFIEAGFPHLLTETKLSMFLKFLNKQYQFTESRWCRSAVSIIQGFLATIDDFLDHQSTNPPPPPPPKKKKRNKHDSSGGLGGTTLFEPQRKNF